MPEDRGRKSRGPGPLGLAITGWKTARTIRRPSSVVRPPTRRRPRIPSPIAPGVRRPDIREIRRAAGG